MKTLHVKSLGGIDERLNSPDGSAKQAVSLRYDSAESRWVHDRGYAAYFHESPGRGAPGTGEGVNSIHIHETQGGATRDIILDIDAGATTSLVRVDNFATSGKMTLATGRHKPGSSEPATCFATLGSVVAAVNGWDAPVKIYPTTSGTPRVEPFGYAAKPAPPVPTAISSTGMSPTPPTSDYFYCLSAELNDITTAYPALNTLGLGNAQGSSANGYRYAYTWVSDTGSESPISEPSTVLTWQNNTVGYRYGVTLTSIQPGPNGTVKRRIYRTINLGQSQSYGEATYFFVGELCDNYTQVYTDHVPDGLLGASAPTATQSDVLPSNVRWITTHASRAWIVAGDYRVHWSQPRQTETFGATDYVDVSARQGGRITGLVANNDLLLILRERGIDAIVESGDSYRSIPVTTDTGSTSPHASITVPGYGCIVVAQDGIYSLSGNYSAGGTGVRIQKLSYGLANTWARINTAALAKAYAWRSYKDQEVTFALPVDGASYPNLQIVLHLDATDAQGPMWTTRTGVQAMCGATGPEGFPYMGGHGFDSDSAPMLLSVWHGVDQYGYVPTTYAKAPRETGKWESNDLDLGNSTISKYLQNVLLTVTKAGINDINTAIYKDGAYSPSTTVQQSPQNVMDGAYVTVYGTESSQQAIIGTSEWSNPGLADIRFDFKSLSAHRYRVSFSCDHVCAFHAFALKFDETEDKPYLPNQNSRQVGSHR